MVLLSFAQYFRASSHSEQPAATMREHPSVKKSPSTLADTGSSINTATDVDLGTADAIRPRSTSLGGRNYKRQKGVHGERNPFADFTFFPESDLKYSGPPEPNILSAKV